MNLKRSFLYSLPVLAVLFGASTAFAAPITVKDVGDSFTVALSGLSSNGDPVSVSESWEVTAVDATSITFEVTLTNTSPTDPSRLTAFAFDTNPNATGGSSGSSIYQHLVLGDGFDVCAENDDNDNCLGNTGNVGLQPEETETFSLTLTFDEISEDGVTLSNFFARLQSVGTNGGSAKIEGEPTCTSCDPEGEGDPVPEPVSALLLATAVGAYGLRRRARS